VRACLTPAILVASLATGCVWGERALDGLECNSSGGCAEGYACIEGLCVAAGQDAGIVTDAAQADIGPGDTATPDLIAPDSATLDLASAERAYRDIALTDTPTADAAGDDALAADAATTDVLARDAAVADALISDVLVEDAVVGDAAIEDAFIADALVADASVADTAPGFDASQEDGGGDPAWPLDPQLPPLTEGDWYRPAVETSWHVQVTPEINTSYSVDLYVIDLFDVDQGAIEALLGAGHQVMCFFSCGTAEDWRSDYVEFDGGELGNSAYGLHEFWIDVRSENVYRIMRARLDLAASKGCSGIVPVLSENHNESTGFTISHDEQLAYNRALANAAHRRGLAVAHTNNLGQITLMLDYVDATSNEQCHQFNECGTLAPFPAAGKPIFNQEYADTYNDALLRADLICSSALSANMRTLIVPTQLNGAFRVSCDE